MNLDLGKITLNLCLYVKYVADKSFWPQMNTDYTDFTYNSLEEIHGILCSTRWREVTVTPFRRRALSAHRKIK